MGMDGELPEIHSSDKAMQGWTMSKHTFSDLSHVSPIVFLYLLKECYSCGTNKASTKFCALQQQVHLALYNTPQPGPAIFVARCLYVLPTLESSCEGFSHLVISALGRLLKKGTTEDDLLKAKHLAAHLFLDIVRGTLVHDERILVKIVETFNVSLISIEEVIKSSFLKHENDMAKAFVEHYICDLLESHSYTTAVSLMEHFSVRKCGESFLFNMIESKQYKAAEKWAAFMGKPMLCLLVQKYSEKNLLKYAYEVIKENGLQQELPDVFFKCRESKLKQLAENGCWDVAEERTKSDLQLLQYLVCLAMEAGYMEKVDELCERYSLRGFMENKGPGVSCVHHNYLHLTDFAVEDVIWVNELNALQSATSKIEECQFVGIDCEWKPNYIKGAELNKASIMQIATQTVVYVLDLIKLFEDAPDTLDNCLTRIFHSPRILKLGYSFQCDIRQLAGSYGELKCFRRYEMLLDIQNLFKKAHGGLSGLAKKIFGASLNKTRRNSNWEQRPLSQNQLEYAALDAVVLVHIFQHVRSHFNPADAYDGSIKWKSHIVSHMDNQKTTKKTRKNSQRNSDRLTDEHSTS